MKKFLLLYFGSDEPSAEVADAWQRWFAGLGDRVVDSGNPLGACLEITRTGSRELLPEEGAPTGYSLISAESLDDAKRLIAGCPFVTAIQICEARRM